MEVIEVKCLKRMITVIFFKTTKYLITPAVIRHNMKIRLIAVGKVKDKRLFDLAEDYLQKISYDCKIDALEIKDSSPAEEGKKITEYLGKIKESKFVFVLSEEGKEFSSIEFSSRLKKLDLENISIIFVIGGPFGLTDEVKKEAGLLFSLSRMTYTHEMARVILFEQIYRAISIMKNRNYHKD